MDLSPNQVFFLDPCPGNKNVIILLHGLGSDSSSWLLQMDFLISHGFRPIAVDIPGFGQSNYSLRHWSIRRAALMIVNQIIDPLDGPVILLGLSLGGVIAQKILQLRPDRFQKLILVSTFSSLRPKINQNLPYLGKRLFQVLSGNIRKQAITVADRIFPFAEQKEWHDYLISQIKNADQRIYRQAMLALSTFNSVLWMRKCKIPCLVITGTDDTTVTAQDQNRLVKIIPKAKQIMIQGGGHAVSVDHSQQFNDSLIGFIAGNS